MKMLKNRKGYKLKELAPVALFFVLATIIMSVGADIVDSVKDDQTADSYAANVSTNGLEGLTEIGDWLPTIGLVVAAAIIIGILVYSFSMRR